MNYVLSKAGEHRREDNGQNTSQLPSNIKEVFDKAKGAVKNVEMPATMFADDAVIDHRYDELARGTTGIV